MYSDNYLEIVLTAVGWDFYGKIVTMIYSLNLHLLPLIFVMFKNWRETQTSMNPRNAVEAEMSRNFFDVGIMMLVIIFFWLPNSNTTFDPAKYTQQIQAVSNDPASSSVFEAAQDSMGVSSSAAIDIPPGWYILMNGMKATINQLKEWMVFSPEATAMLTVFNNLKIEDDEIRAESDLFHSMCYLPALKRFQNAQMPLPSIAAEDLNYIGNNLFLNTPGLYKACSQSDIDSNNCLGSPLTMPLTSANQAGIPTKFTDPTTIVDGRVLSFSSTPSCRQWWTGDFDPHYKGGTLSGIVPLKDKMYEQAVLSASDQASLTAIGINTGSVTSPSASFSSNFTNWMKSALAMSDSEAKDTVIQSMLKIDPPSLAADPDDLYPEPEGIIDRAKLWGQKALDGVQGFIGGVGAGMVSLTLGVVLEVLKPALTMIQAGLIFAVLLYLAITLPIGGFSAEAVIKHGMVILGILILPLIWHVADLLNEGLVRVLYPSAVTMADMELGTESFVFQIFLFVLYILLPMMFVFMMRTAGQEISSSFSTSMEDFKDAGNKGASKAASVVKK